MATTSDLRCSETTFTLLLPRLVQIWAPDHSAGCHESYSSPLSERAPRSQVPPLISFLENLSDVLTPDEFPGKKLPCGHVVSSRSILACCNFFGDETWTPGPHFFGCAQPECTDTLEFPHIPDPRVVDGLEARLNLIEWSWRKDKPTAPDMKTVSLLRDILSRIGHLSREPEPETDGELCQPEPSEKSLLQTLVHMEVEAFGLMAESGELRAEVAVRGMQDYCSYRAPTLARTDLSQLRYPMLSPGQECECVTPHEFERGPSTWALTPAETDRDHNEPSRNEKTEIPKTVRFVAPVVMEVQYFEPWWNDEYRDSDRYWSKGPHRRSVDLSTSVDDEWEILRLDDPEGFVALMVKRLEEQESECGMLFEDSDEMDEGDEFCNEDIVDEMDEVNELCDVETSDEMERVDESPDDGTVDKRETYDELGYGELF